MMNLVIFFAVASASIAPMVHLWEAGVVGGGGAMGLLQFEADEKEAGKLTIRHRLERRE